MADQADVFKVTNTEAPKDLVAELVGEGKKYKTAEDLARSRIEADVHIQRIELENKEMREKLAAAKSVEDILEAVKANTASAKDTPDTKDTPPATGGITADQVAKIVAEQVTGIRTKEVRESNLSKANAKMVELFGEKAQEVYLKEASTPELQKVYRELAEVNPDKFVAMFTPKDAKGQNIDTGGNKNTAALNLNQNLGQVVPGTQAFYAKLRKENPKQYYSPSVQLQMHKDALTDPDKYFGRK